MSAFTAIAWAVSPQLYAIALDGVETILATCLGLAFLLLFCHLESVGYARARGRLVLAAGLTFALAFLGRMDTPLLIGPLLLSALIQLVRARRTILVAALAFVSGAPPLAWLVMSYLLTGDVMPTSGSAMRTLRGVDNLLFVPSDRMLALTKHLASQLVDFFVYVPPKVEIVLLALMAVTAVIALGKYYSPFAPDVSPSIVRFAILVGCGQVAWISYYILYQGSFRRWYFSQLGVGVFVLVVPAMVTLLSGAVRRVPIWHKMNVSRQQMSKVLLPGACLALSFLSRFLIPPTSPQAYDKYRSALAANVIMAEIDPAATIGAFNSGIYDYFMDRDVINLDGVVNPDSLEAVRHGRLPEYLDRINMKYLIEHDIGEAANLDLLTEDDHIEIVKWVDLSLYYDGYSGAYAKRAYLWRINLTLGE